VLNSLENVRASIELLHQVRRRGSLDRRETGRLLERAMEETRDARDVLAGAGLHPDAVQQLERARALEKQALHSLFFRAERTRQAIQELVGARDRLVES
jgi:hypothetical protein